MSKAAFKTVEEYISAFPDETQAALKQVRSAICKALPKAEEVLSYNMPAYKLRGETILYFAGWKHHFSLYPASEHVLAACKDEITTSQVSKGTIRFSLSDPVPAKLIERIARARAKEVAQRDWSKPL